MSWIILGFCAAAGAYQLLAIAATLIQLRKRDPAPVRFDGISILKPVKGRDEHFLAAIQSHARQGYPTFEVLFGVRDLADPAVADIAQLQAEFPHVCIRVIHVKSEAPNGKVGSLMDLAAEARYPVLLVNDSDIEVPAGYLKAVTAPLENPCIGLVTCLYMATGSTAPARWEALGISTDFAPSAVVAPLVGVKEFGLGSTLAFRRTDLSRIGGFAPIGDYIADDYQLGKQISALGLQVVIARVPVKTHLGSSTWRSMWLHQVRWARTIRLSRGAYLGLPIANGTIWALVAAVADFPVVAGVLLALRYAAGFVMAYVLLGDRTNMLWLMGVRDLFGFAVWCAGISGDRVVWRGEKIRLDAGGRIASVE